MKHQPKIYIALPLLNEYEYLPELMRCLKNQSFQSFEVIACVNQYESWWDQPEKHAQCLNNQESIQYLEEQAGISITIIDKSSKGQGWPDKRGGVGWARKTAMDRANEVANASDLIVSMDADTEYPPDYLHSIVEAFSSNPDITGLSLPYYHRLANDETDILILRYEIYMRNYLLNMLLINNPYSFTALGSAMTAPVWAYRKIGGLTPVKSGEDFYFLQKLAKTGKLGIWASTLAFPSPRFSNRVSFGTGPALIKGKTGDWDSYPVYPTAAFDLVHRTFDSFGALFEKDVPTPMDDFLMKQFKTRDIWSSLRNNSRQRHQFVKACKTKVDGLRILQFLKQSHLGTGPHPADGTQDKTEKTNFRALNKVCDVMNGKPPALAELIQLRDELFDAEMELREKIQQTGI